MREQATRGLWPTLAAAAITAGALGSACDDDGQRAEQNGAAGESSAAGGAPAGGRPHVEAGSSPGPDAPTSLDAFLEAEADGYCARLYRCNESSDDFQSARYLLGDEAGCKAELALVNERSIALSDLRAQIDAGNIHLAPDTAAKCIAQLSECNGPNSLNEGSCPEAFDGDVEQDGECHRDEDCAGDAYCKVEAACPGTCQPRKAPGQPCDFASECAFSGAGVLCDHDAMPRPVCRVFTRTPDAGEGEPCTWQPLGVSDVTYCEDGLWCRAKDAPADAMGECVKPLASDASCSEAGDVCQDALCNAIAGMCQPLTVLSKAGDSCNKEELRICDPHLGLRCGEDGECESSGGDGSENSPCFTGDFQRRCDPGLYCRRDADTDAFTCQPLLGADAACASSESCASGSCDGTCLQRFCEY